MNCDKTIGEANFEDGEEEVATFVSEEDARHIARLHNKWRYNQLPFTDEPDEPVEDVIKAFNEGEKGATGHGQQADHQRG